VIGKLTIKQFVFGIQHEKYQIKPAAVSINQTNQSIKPINQSIKPIKQSNQSKQMYKAL